MNIVAVNVLRVHKCLMEWSFEKLFSLFNKVEAKGIWREKKMLRRKGHRSGQFSMLCGIFYCFYEWKHIRARSQFLHRNTIQMEMIVEHFIKYANVWEIDASGCSLDCLSNIFRERGKYSKAMACNETILQWHLVHLTQMRDSILMCCLHMFHEHIVLECHIHGCFWMQRI